MLNTLNSPKDWTLCCIRTFFYLRSSTGAAVARNNFDVPRVNNIKGHFHWIAAAYPHCVCFLQVGGITRHNCLASKLGTVLLEIHWIRYWNRLCKKL